MTDLETIQRLCPICEGNPLECNRTHARPLDRATQALKDASLAYAAAQGHHTGAKLVAMNVLFRAAEDYAELYLKRGGK